MIINFLQIVLMLIIRIGIALVVLLGLAFVGLMVFINLHDWSREITTHTQALIGRPVVIGGTIRPGLQLKDPTLVIHDISLPAVNPGDVALHADKISFHISDLYAIVRDGNWVEKLALDTSIQNLSIDKEKFSAIDFTLHTKKYGFDLRPLRITYGAAQFKGSLAYEKNHARLDGQIKKFNYGKYVKDMTGTLDADIALKTHGATPKNMLYNITGKVGMTAGAGTIPGRIIDLWAADITTALLPLPGKKKNTELVCGVGVFDIQNGIADSQILLDTKRVLLTGKGHIDLIAGRLDLDVFPEPKKSSLMSMATPVHIKGDWANPSVSPFKTAILAKIGGLVLGTINPAALAFSFSKLGHMDNNPCMTMLTEHGKEGPPKK